MWAKQRKKVKKHFFYFFLHFTKKNVLRNTTFYVRTRFRMLHIAIARYRVFTVYILKIKSKWLYVQNQDFCFQIKSYYFIFFKKKVGNTAKISTCISERIVQFLKLLLYYTTRSNFLLGFLLLYLNEFRLFFPPFFLPLNCNFILFKNVVQYSNSKLSKLSNFYFLQNGFFIFGSL